MMQHFGTVSVVIILMSFWMVLIEEILIILASIFVLVLFHVSCSSEILSQKSFTRLELIQIKQK